MASNLSHSIPTLPWRGRTTWSLTLANTIPLVVGLALFGFGEGLLALSGLGATPWTVFALGLAKHLGISVGWTTLLVSAVVMLAWIPLRERPGAGTVANTLIIALVLGLTVELAAPHALVLRMCYMLAGVWTIGFGGALYLTTGLGPGPRDGLMTSLHRRLGVSVVYVRLSLEVTVLAVGWLLGGTAGVGTVLFAGAIGFALGVNLTLITRATTFVTHRRSPR